MPSEFNHIDEFFRKKEEESEAPDHLLNQHWQQMKKELAGPVQSADAIRTFHIRLYGRAAAILLFVVAAVFLLFYNRKPTALPSHPIARQSSVKKEKSSVTQSLVLTPPVPGKNQRTVSSTKRFITTIKFQPGTVNEKLIDVSTITQTENTSVKNDVEVMDAVF